MELLEQTALPKKTIDVDPMRATDDAVMFVTSAGAIIRDARAGLRPVAAG